MTDYTAGKAWKVERKQHIMDSAFALFAEKGIEAVTIPEIAAASGVSKATIFRYFDTKLDLVVEIAAQLWESYITAYPAQKSEEELESLTAAEYLRFYLDSFIDLYRNHGEILRFNYEFNIFLRKEKGNPDQKRSYLRVVNDLGVSFHDLYERGKQDQTLNLEIPEETMFSSTFHIMLAAVTRYAVGLVYVSEKTNPESELLMLEQLLLSRFTRTP